MNFWSNGSHEKTTYKDVLEEIKQHSSQNGQIYIGTDSQIVKKECIYSTAICLHGATDQIGGRYYFKRTRFKVEKFPTLIRRITHEVENTVSTALDILGQCPTVNIELHLDISASDKKEATSRFADMLVGYAKGVGFPCKIKPDAFAASSVADKHNK